jgi:hypothetical protein
MTTKHPYQGIPRYARWKQGVNEGVDRRELIAGLRFHGLRDDDRVFSAGSCFASNMVPYLEKAGIAYIRTEPRPQAFSRFKDGLGYDNFSARFGNIYTSRQFLQLLLRCTARWAPMEDRWRTPAGLVDPFRPGLTYLTSSDEEFDALTLSHLSATRVAIETATVVVFTLGLTEAWHATDGAVFPVCPGTVAGEFDSNKHHFMNLSTAQVTEDLLGCQGLISELNPKARFVLTVSPVPLTATATGKHVVVASLESKAVLRAAVAGAQAARNEIEYFPAYELLMGWQTPPGSWDPDMRTVTRAGLDYVMSVLLAGEHPPTNQRTNANRSGTERLSQLIAKAECDEAAYDNFAADSSG